jgi:excisionase family DNA binding protein
MPTERLLITTAEVAKLVRVPESTVRYWRHCRRGPHSFKVGRHVVYWQDDVEAWLASCDEADTRDRRAAS